MRPENPLTFVGEAYSEDTGGGFTCDVLVLDDGSVLVISEEAIVLYRDRSAWETGSNEQEGTIFRSSQ